MNNQIILRKLGFTLIEILVSITILSVGFSGVWLCIDYFEQNKKTEEIKAKSLILSIQLMESLIEKNKICNEEKYEYKKDAITLEVNYKPLSAYASLEWIVIRNLSDKNQDSLKRIVRCKIKEMDLL